MISAVVPVGARLVDCVTALTDTSAAELRRAGVDGAIRYLGSVTAEEMADITAAGLGALVVTYADRFDGSTALAELTAIGYPAGATVWLDVEGLGAKLEASVIVGEINAWARVVQGAGYLAGLYVGANALLTSAELTALLVTRYWRGMSRIRDRADAPAEPASGYCMAQLYPTTTIAGVSVDVDFAGHDWDDRSASWAVATTGLLDGPSSGPTLPGA